jgi:ABC-type nitrate/sulfonate/bicarbonate transport system ATPase subunit
MTSILVTHDEDEANAFADRVGTIKNKKLKIALAASQNHN